MKNFMDELANNIGNDIILGDPPREISYPKLGSIKVQVTTMQDEIEVSSKPGAPKFDPGEALADQFSTPRQCGGGKTCSGASLKAVQYTNNLISSDRSKQSDDVEIIDSQVCNNVQSKGNVKVISKSLCILFYHICVLVLPLS